MSTKSSLSIIAGVFLLIAVVTQTAIACGWFGTSRSVRFNVSETERSMGRLPPLPTGMPDDDCFDCENVDKGADAVWDRAEEAELQGKLTEVRTLLSDYLKKSELSYPTDRQQRRNSAFDRLDALSALDHGSKTSRVQAYLNARRNHDQNQPAQIEDALSQVSSDFNLKDNVAYLRAAQLYREEKFDEAAQAFSTIARQYPRSEKREASLFMASVAGMKTSVAFSGTSGDEQHAHEYGPDSEPHKVEIDDAWHVALAGFKRVMTQYPRGRYHDDARGWIAYLQLRNNDRARALVEYYRLLADKQNETTRIEAAFSLDMVRHHATNEEMLRVEKQLAAEPEAALAYLYYDIYNNSLASGYPPYEEVKDYKGDYDPEATRLRNEELSKDWTKKQKQETERHLTRVLNFSRRLIDRYPNLAIGGAFALRTAQASVEMDRNEDAAQFARRALQSPLKDEERMQALWILGVAQHRSKHFGSARDSFNKLLHYFPKTELTEGARSHLAMIAEDSGDLHGALEQYLALNYTVDVAYLIDVLMTHGQLANFIEQHADSPRINELTYALGVRYLRSNRWDDARATFAKVRTVATTEPVDWSDDCLTDQCIDPKEGELNEEREPIITTRLVMHDVQTANDLETLESAVNHASTDEAKAEAMYQLASYQYEATSLLFYNPVAWRHERYWNLSYLTAENRYRATNEAQVLFAYMQEHDTLARALKIYLEVADKYPQTRAARDSLYTAAVCHERLAEYNSYWREIYGARLHAGARLVTYTNVKASYPSYQLPRGTYGWQPSTRTVNYGPGWATPPKQIPRPSRFARAKLLLENFINPIVVFWNKTGRRGLSLLTILVAMGFTTRIATQNRKLLRPKLLRVRARYAQQAPVDEPPAEMFWTDPRDELLDRAKLFLKKRMIEFWELARDSKSRPVLIMNLASHSFLVGLILSLLWTLHS
jgi:TolA-binding protein